jgi:hypothetical protein
VCHAPGIAPYYSTSTMPNAPKLRPRCERGCGKRILPQRIKYCSQRCQHEHYRERIIALWRSGELPPSLNFNHTVRRHLIAVKTTRPIISWSCARIVTRSRRRSKARTADGAARGGPDCAIRGSAPPQSCERSSRKTPRRSVRYGPASGAIPTPSSSFRCSRLFPA